MLTRAERAVLNARYRKRDRVLTLMRTGPLREEFTPENWEKIGVAVRLVFETEDFLDELSPRRPVACSLNVSYWLDSLETQMEFLGWARMLAHTVQEVRFSTKPLSGDLRVLRRRHRALSAQLLERRTSEVQRWRALVTLGAIEIALLGILWDLEGPGSGRPRGASPSPIPELPAHPRRRSRPTKIN